MMAKQGHRSKGRRISRMEISQPQHNRQCAVSTATPQNASASAVLDASPCVKYSPVARIPSKNDLQRALAELARLEEESETQNIHENERDVHVVLATEVKLQRWLSSGVANSSKCVRFEVVVQDVVAAEAIDESTKCDIIIIKVVGELHQRAVQEISGQMRDFAIHECNDIFCVGGGRRLFTTNASGKTSLREPDVTLTRKGNHVPTIIVEFEDKNRSLDKLNQWCRGFFYSPGVRQVIGVKMYPPDNYGMVAALAIQYGYNNAGVVDILDAVSFGQRNVVRQHMPLSIWNRIRFLEVPTQGQITTRRSPWPTHSLAQAEILATQKPLPSLAEAQEREKRRVGFLTVSRAECIYSDNSIQLAAAGNDLQLNLFRILFQFLDQ
jgi:hypothetical protein